jgi:hypothetical protein
MISFKGTNFPKDVILVLSLFLLSVVTLPVQAEADYTVTRSCPNDFSSITFISAPSVGMYSEKEKQLTNHLLDACTVLVTVASTVHRHGWDYSDTTLIKSIKYAESFNVPILFIKVKEWDAVWQVIPIDPELEITDSDGNLKTINPACAVNSITKDGDNPFYFLFQQGESDKLVIYFNGGGVCWSDDTCVRHPVYTSDIREISERNPGPGLFDDENVGNPFKKWSKVFIPYCTGDLHVGSSTQVYTDSDGTKVELKHHGFDNFLAVKQWIESRFSKENSSDLKNMVVVGTSGGGYGATLNFPHLQDAFPNIKAALLADSSVFITNQDFIDLTFNNRGIWNLKNTLPTIISEKLGNFTACGFNTEIYTTLTGAYPDSRFAQVVSEYDSTLVYFLNKTLEGNSPDRCDSTLSEDDELKEYWKYRMESSLDSIANTKDNYQFYIRSGNEHNILPINSFYTEQSGGGIFFSDWLGRFADEKEFRQENLKYSD